MVRDNVINTYFSIYNMYKHLSSPEEQIDNLKQFQKYLDETYSNNDKTIKYTHTTKKQRKA